MMERAMARCLGLAGRHAEALERLGDLQRRALRLDGEESFEYAMTTWQLAVLARRRAAPQDGLGYAQLAEQLFGKLLPDTHPIFAYIRRARADFALMQGDIALAEQLQREAIERLEVAAVLPVDLAIARAELGAILLTAGRRDAARTSLSEALPILRASLLEGENTRAVAEANARLLGLPGA
jgi:serine/threonine-protein kinase